MAGALLVAGACAFTPVAHLAPRQIDRARSTAAPVIDMAGWNDPYDVRNNQKGKTLKVKKTSFDEEMEAINAENNKKLLVQLGGTLAAVGIPLAYYLSTIL